VSQIYKPLTSAGPIPPTIATTYVTNVNSPAVPAANILNVLGGQTATDNNLGLQTDGSSGGNILTVQLTNRMTAVTITVGATSSDIITFPLPAVAGTYFVYGNVQAFTSTGPAGGGYSFTGAYLTNGAAATELGTEYHDTFQSAALLTSDISLSASGNNVVLTVTGVAGLTIDWNALLEFRSVS